MYFISVIEHPSHLECQHIERYDRIPQMNCLTSKQNPIRWELCSNPMHALKKKVWEMYAPTPTSPPPFPIPFNGVHQQVWLSLLQGVPLHGVFCWGSITRVGWLSNIHTYPINQGMSLLLVDCCNVCRHILASPLLQVPKHDCSSPLTTTEFFSAFPFSCVFRQ